MKPNEKDQKAILDHAVEELRTAEPPAGQLEAASGKVWQRLTGIAPAAGQDIVEGCAGFAAMIGAYRDRSLSAAKRELFDDHVRECVECRRAVWADGERVRASAPAFRRSAAARWALAAAAVLVAGVGLKVGVLDRLGMAPEGARLIAERVDGTLYHLQGGQLVPLAAAVELDASEVVRAGRGSRAVLRLADGTRVEMNEHAELSVEPRADGTAIALRRGDIIVEAAKQRPGRHLFVTAPDCEVAVKGTVFTVAHGLKGSRVSVLEGEVWVEQGSEVVKLAPGQQTATQSTIGPVPVADEVAWSSNPERYAALLHELSEVSTRMMASLANVPLRYQTALISRLPADTFMVAAVPNVSQEVAAAGEDLIARIQSNPQLGAWFAEHRAQHPDAPDMVEALGRFRQLGGLLGDEVLLAVAGPPAVARPSVVLLAEAGDEARLRTSIQEELQRLRSQAGHEIPVVVVEDIGAIPAVTGNALFLWVGGGLAVATDDPARLVRLAAGGDAFAATPFHAQLARSYAEGVSWLFAADLGRLTAEAATGEASALEDLGLTDLQYAIVEHKRIASQGQLRGALSFSRERRGVPAWLGAPAPMGALEFVSPDAYAVGCFLAKQPEQIADEILAVVKKRDPEGFGRFMDFQREHGLSLRDDLAAPLGGEFLVAIDGPVLPTPAWKMVVLVEDQSRLQQALEHLLSDVNARLAAEGRPPLTLRAADEGGARFFTLAAANGALELHYTFRDGYWLIAPSRVLLTRALETRASGLSLPASAEFRGAMPTDAQQQYSALAFVNAKALGSALASAVPSGTTQQQASLAEIKRVLSEASTMALCVSAEKDRILLTGTGVDILNPGQVMSSLLGNVARTAPGGLN